MKFEITVTHEKLKIILFHLFEQISIFDLNKNKYVFISLETSNNQKQVDKITKIAFIKAPGLSKYIGL